MMDKSKLEFLRKKIRISMLGEPSLISQNRVIALCEKFFEYGIEYEKKLNAIST